MPGRHISSLHENMVSVPMHMWLHQPGATTLLWNPEPHSNKFSRVVHAFKMPHDQHNTTFHPLCVLLGPHRMSVCARFALLQHYLTIACCEMVKHATLVSCTWTFKDTLL